LAGNSGSWALRAPHRGGAEDEEKACYEGIWGEAAGFKICTCRYPTKYPPNTASFQVRSTDGAMPTGKSFSAFPETMNAGAEAGEARRKKSQA